MSDRTIITVVLGAGVNGLYAVANKFPNIFIQIYNIFNLTWMESVAININEKDNFTYSDRFSFIADSGSLRRWL